MNIVQKNEKQKLEQQYKNEYYRMLKIGILYIAIGCLFLYLNNMGCKKNKPTVKSYRMFNQQKILKNFFDEKMKVINENQIAHEKKQQKSKSPKKI